MPIEDAGVDRQAVRVAALRAILATAATPCDGSPGDADDSVARLLIAGYGVNDICAALAIEPAVAHGIIMRLAR